MTASPLMRTTDGWEMQFATNHLGHFALTTGLHDALAAAGDARVVSVSSRGHQYSPVVFDDIMFERRDYDPWLAYGQSKTANVLFAMEANRRWAGDGTTVNALHPGGIHTNLARHLSQEELARITSQANLAFKTPEQGAAPRRCWRHRHGWTESGAGTSRTATRRGHTSPRRGGA